METYTEDEIKIIKNNLLRIYTELKELKSSPRLLHLSENEVLICRYYPASCEGFPREYCVLESLNDKERIPWLEGSMLDDGVFVRRGLVVGTIMSGSFNGISKTQEDYNPDKSLKPWEIKAKYGIG